MNALQRVKRELIRRRWKPADLARAVHTAYPTVPPSSVYRWLSGQHDCRVERTLEPICGVLGLDLQRRKRPP
jgi:hypothetical protein